MKTILFFMFAHFSHHVLTALLVPLLPMIRDSFALNYGASGLVLSAFSLAYGFGQLPAGWLSDRLGPRMLLLAGTVGVALTGVLIGVAPGFVALVVGLMLMGILGGGYHPAAAPLISAAVAPTRRGRALGFHIIGGSASHFMAPLLGVAVAAAVGWRGAYLWLSLPVLAFGLFLYFRLRPAQTQAASASSDRPNPAAPSGGVDFALIGVFLALTSVIAMVFNTVVSFVPLFFTDYHQQTDAAAAAYLAVVWSVGIWGGPAGGWLSDRFGRLPLVAASGLALVPTLVLLAVAPAGPAAVAVLVVFGLVMFVRMPVSEAFLVEQVPPHLRSTVLGVYFFAGIEGGALLSPVFGAAVDAYGFKATLLGAATVYGVVVAALLAALFLVTRRRAALRA